jgi:hypothetical protein
LKQHRGAFFVSPTQSQGEPSDLTCRGKCAAELRSRSFRPIARSGFRQIA